MTLKKRKMILQNDNSNSRLMAKKLLDKGYEVMLKYPDSEEVVPFPS